MHYIKDIFEKKESEHSHNKFIRYSKGEFQGPIISLKVQKAGIKLNSSFHLSDEILMLFSDYLGDKEIAVKGVVSWNRDLNPELEASGIKYLKVSKARGIFNYKLENDIKLKSFVNTMGKYNVLLSFKEDDCKVTMKPKFPKPNKEVGADFVKSLFPSSLKDRILDEFCFDCDKKSIKEIEIDNKIIVNDIEYPKDDSMGFDEIRRLARRVGTITRTIVINGGEPIITKVDFKV